MTDTMRITTPTTPEIKMAFKRSSMHDGSIFASRSKLTCTPPTTNCAGAKLFTYSVNMLNVMIRLTPSPKVIYVVERPVSH